MACISNPNVASTSSAQGPSTSSEVSNSPSDFVTQIVTSVTIEADAVCDKCPEGHPALSKCKDCSKLLCANCISDHRRNPLTKEHKISGFNGKFFAPPNVAYSSPRNRLNITCDMHLESYSLFCQSCYVPTCNRCILERHSDHQLIIIEDAFVTAKRNYKKLFSDTSMATKAVKDALINVQRMAHNVELRSMCLASEIRSTMRKCVTLIKEREIEFLAQLDQARQMKGGLLLAQIENLRFAQTKLDYIAEILNIPADPTKPLDLFKKNERATRDLNYLRALRPELAPCEDDFMVFQQPDPSLYRTLSTMGCLTVSASSMIMRRSSCGNGDMTVAIRYNFADQIFRNRSIYGVDRVLVKKSGYLPSLIFGGEGDKDGQLCRPWGICCDHNGNFIVADRSNNRIQIFSPMGEFLGNFGGPGTGYGQFDRPAGVAVDPHGNIVVADKDNHRIQVFKMDGTFILAFGEKGFEDGQFNYPWDVACNSLANIVVSDTRNHRIQLFTSDGKFLNKYGYDGISTGYKHFDSPRGVSFMPNGKIIVTDFNNHRVVVVDQTLMHAKYIGQEGSGYKQFERPQGVVCDDEGNIIVADSRNNRLQVFDRDGNFMWKIGVPGRFPGQMDRPSGICVDPEGRIAVVDFGNNRVQAF